MNARDAAYELASGHRFVLMPRGSLWRRMECVRCGKFYYAEDHVDEETGEPERVERCNAAS